MLTITYAPENQALADRIQKDLESKRHQFSSALEPGAGNILIALMSSVAQKTVESAIVDALDNGQHIIPVLLENVTMPKLIDHLQPVNFVGAYNLLELERRIQVLASGEAGIPLRVLTPRARQKNRNFGYWLAIIAIIWFIIGVVLVGFFGAQAPRETYNAIATQDFATIQSYLNANVPRTTDEAVKFPVTVQAAPTAQRPYLIATATAIASSQ
jgi:hypothetical protein